MAMTVLGKACMRQAHPARPWQSVHFHVTWDTHVPKWGAASQMICIVWKSSSASVVRLMALASQATSGQLHLKVGV